MEIANMIRAKICTGKDLRRRECANRGGPAFPAELGVVLDG